MKFAKETVARWAKASEAFLSEKGLTLADIKTGADAWYVASKVGVLEEAYVDRTVVDAHIATALEKIFTAAVFKDKKVY